MAATWVPAWRVSPDGERVHEYRVSVTEYSVTVREVGETRGGQRYGRWHYDLYFGTSRAEAIEKFLSRQTIIHGKARAEMEMAQLLINRATTLQEAAH
jgi:hypothetical protein